MKDSKIKLPHTFSVKIAGYVQNGTGFLFHKYYKFPTAITTMYYQLSKGIVHEIKFGDIAAMQI